MHPATLLVRSERLTPRPDGTWELVLVLAPQVPQPDTPKRSPGRQPARPTAHPARDEEGVPRGT
jgi:hypothetical protein